MSTKRLIRKTRVLAIDDDPNVTWILSDSLNERNFTVEYCNDGRTAVRKLSQFHPDICLLDVKMPGMNGLELLNYIKKTDPAISVIMISGHSDTPIIVQAVQGGADDFIVKPFDVEMVEICIYKVLDRKNLHRRVTRLESELALQSIWSQWVGDSEAMQATRETIEQIAATDLTVLIQGERGTGRGLCARLIHQLSDHERGPFSKIDCGAMTGEQLERELLGYEQGAFDGAVKARPGRFELAQNGTIFLDRADALTPALQTALAGALEHKEFVRLGGTRPVKADFRLIGGADNELERRVAREEFNLNLFYRMSDVILHLPPLRERKEDILLLTQYFLKKYSEKFNKTSQPLSTRNERLLLTYAWPGNVWELENLMKRAAIFGQDEIAKNLAAPGRPAGTDGGSAAAPGRLMSPAMLPDSYFEHKTLREISEAMVGQIERRAIELCLDRFDWNRRRASQELDISYRCLLYKIQQYELKREKTAGLETAEAAISNEAD